jgi:hypothetical protein
MTIRTVTIQAVAAGVGYPTQGGTFKNVSLNRPSDVDPDPGKTAPYSLAAGSGQDVVFGAWTSGIWAPELGTSGSYLHWGGGHSARDGNEVYCFDVATRTWTRHTEPYPANSTNPATYPNDRASQLYVPGDTGWIGGSKTGTEPDGQPYPTHTYQCMGYLSSAAGGGTSGSLIVSPVDGFSVRGQTGDAWWRLDLATKKWSIWHLMNDFGGIRASAKVLMVPEYDSGGAFRYFWYLGIGQPTTRLARFDALKTRTNYSVGGGTGGYWCGAINPANRHLVAVATDSSDNAIILYNLAQVEAGVTGSIVGGANLAVRYAVHNKTNMPPAVGNQGAGSHGITWCPEKGQFACHAVAGKIHWLVPPTDWWNGTWSWTVEDFTAADGSTPNTLSGNGEFGRFVWVPSIKCFLHIGSSLTTSGPQTQYMQAYRPAGV